MNRGEARLRRLTERQEPEPCGDRDLPGRSLTATASAELSQIF